MGGEDLSATNDAQPASELDSAAVLDVLPDDAPPGHDAFRMCEYMKTHKWPHALFFYGPNKIRFQVTLGACGTKHCSEVIARACYMRFDQGDTQDEVKAFRAACYDRVQYARGCLPKARLKNMQAAGLILPDGSLVKMAASGETGTREHREVVEASNLDSVGAQTKDVDKEVVDVGLAEPPKKTEPPKRLKMERLLGEVTERVALALQSATPEQDVEPGHVAFKKVKISRSAGRSSCFRFYYDHPDGTKEPFQVQAKENCDESTAERIARLCYVQFEAGLRKPEVVAYRDALFEQWLNAGSPTVATLPLERRGERSKATPAAEGGETGDGGEGGQPAKKRRRTAVTEDRGAIAQQLREDGRDADAIDISGREGRNASVNGIYAKVRDGFGGTHAYKKCSSSSDEPARYLIFTSRKRRWQITDELLDSKGCFAFAKTNDQGLLLPSDPSLGLKWNVASGKEKGYVEDPAVRCTTLLQADGENGLERQSKPVSGKEIKDGSSGSSDSDSDVSESSSDASKSRSANASATTSIPQGRVCAKMMVRAGRRCRCHFAFVHECRGSSALLR